MEMAMPVYQIIFCTDTQYFTSTADINYSQKILSLRVKKLKDQAYTSQMNTIRHRIKSAGKFKQNPLKNKARPACAIRTGGLYFFVTFCIPKKIWRQKVIRV